MEAQYTTRVARSNGPHSSLLTISPKRTARKSCYQSVDKSLKVFLRISNLSGLEYRLRLAGYYTLGDLLSTNVELLCAGGITSLMARRLLNALDEYIQSHMELEEGANQPFKLVRKGQKIPSEPSKQMMALPTYGKQNKKRKRSVEDGSEMSNPDAASTGSGKKSGKSLSKIRLMTAGMLNQKYFVLSTLLEEEKKKEEEKGEEEEEEEEEKEEEKEKEEEEEEKEKEEEKEEEEEGEEEGEEEVEEEVEEEEEEEEKEEAKEEEKEEGEKEEKEEEGRGNLHDGVEKEDTQFGSERVDYNIVFRDSIFLSNPGSLTQSVSLPEDFQWSKTQEPEAFSWYPWFQVRCYSSPGSLASPTPTTMESLVNTLTSAVEDDTVFIALRSLIVKCKYHSLETKAEKYDAVAAVADVLQRRYDHPDVAVQGCIALKYLTRNGRRPDESSVERRDFVLLLLFQFPPSQDGCLRRCCL